MHLYKCVCVGGGVTQYTYISTHTQEEHLKSFHTFIFGIVIISLEMLKAGGVHGRV